MKGSWFDVGTPKSYLGSYEKPVERRLFNVERFRREIQADEAAWSGCRVTANDSDYSVVKKLFRKSSRKKSLSKAPC